MRTRFIRLGLFSVASCLVVAGEAAYAETRTATALTPEAVGAAIDAAQDGDTVQLPAGKAVWSKKGWNTGHCAKVKAITIQGAGIDKTIIGDDQEPGRRRLVSIWREWKASPSASPASPSTDRYTPMRGTGAG